MQIRPIHLSTPNRINHINELYGTSLKSEWLNQSVFQISEIQPGEKQSLLNIANKYHNALVLVVTAKQNELFMYAKSAHKIPNEIVQQMPGVKNINAQPVQVTWPLNHGELKFSKVPLVMGILNVTPDSFSDGGKFDTVKHAVERALQLQGDGANIIDVGGESTRPGAEPVSLQMELERVVPVIQGIRKHSNIPISIDTYKSQVAKAALEAGADIVNDVSGTSFDSEMPEVLKEFNCPVIVMHIKGTPKNMQKNPFYQDVMLEVYRYFEEKINQLNQMGVHKIILDPGIGFGKRFEDNLTIIRDLKDFSFLGYPVLMGLSRKTFIGNIIDRSPVERDSASLVANIQSWLNNAQVLRVHNVMQTVDAIKVIKAIQNI